MSATATPNTEVKELRNLVASQQKQIEGLSKSLTSLVDTLKKTPMNSHPNASQVFGAPGYVIGESPNSSRGFSFIKMLGLIAGQCPREQAKIELDIHSKMNKAFGSGGDLGSLGYDYGASKGITGVNRFLAPLASNFMFDGMTDRNFRKEMREVVRAGTDGADHDEMAWIRRKHLQAQGYGSKALSWLNELTGGALVAPPEQGELIELLRNKEALVNAGARVVPLPPQGRLKYPRQTAPSNTYWVGESSPIPESILGTGEVTLQAKKLAVLIKAPNELVRFASPAAEALMRDDMTKSLALGLDLAGLEGAGGDHRPRGVLNFQGITKLTSSINNVNGGGDQLVGQDLYRFPAAVEEANAEFEAYIMRPKTLYKIFQLRADAVSQGDKSGLFLFNLVREAGDGVTATVCGFPVVKSTQVSQVRSQGNKSNLTYIVGGMWSDLLIGMFGAIEFAATTLGDTAFVNDQTWVRGILSSDIAARHEAAFVWMDNLDVVSL